MPRQQITAVLVCLTWIAAFEAYGQADGTVRWEVNFGSRISTPALSKDGNIYFCTAAGLFFSVTTNGTTNWVRQVGTQVSSGRAGPPPAIASDGRIYFATFDGRFYSLSQDGSTNWWIALPSSTNAFRCAPAIANDGTVYVSFGTDNSSVLLAINPAGTTNWSIPLASAYGGTMQFSSPAIGSDGTVYIGTHAGLLYSVSPGGTTKWAYKLGHPIYASPTIGSDETIYVGGDGGALLYAVNRFGQLKWKTTQGGYNEASPSIGTNGWLYTGGLNDTFGAFDPKTGSNIWQTSISSSGSPAIAQDGTVYAVDWHWARLHAFSTAGSNLWTFSMPANSLTSPLIAGDGTVYVTCGSRLFAVNATSPPAQTEWPMFRRDAQRQARKTQCGLDRLEIASDRSTLLSLRMETGLAYTLQGTMDFVNWSSVTQFVTPLPAVTVRDYTASNYSSRYYRLVTP